MFEYPWEPLFSKKMLVDLSHIVPVPKLEIDFMKGFEEFFKGWNSQILKPVDLIKFRKGFGDISIVIPKGMVQIEEKVLVCFQNVISVGKYGFEFY